MKPITVRPGASLGYKHNPAIALVGWAPTSRHLAPYERAKAGGIDLMGLNEAAKYDWFGGGATSWLQIHPRWDYLRAHNRNDPDHAAWLRQTHDFPIFMQAEFDDIPNSVRYPIESAYDLGHGYLTSSFAYMFALAVMMRYERIEVYGFDMSHDSEYADQKPCAEYWIGKAEGLGIEVVLPPACPLLRGNLYAYEDLRAADRTYLSVRVKSLESSLIEKQSAQYYWQGRAEQIQSILGDANASEEVKTYLAPQFLEVLDTYKQAQQVAASVGGQVDELRTLIAWHDSQNVPADRKVESGGEEVVHAD